MDSNTFTRAWVGKVTAVSLVMEENYVPALCYSTSLLLKLHPSTNSSVELRAGWLGKCNLENFASGVLVLESEVQAAAG
jgi:hypothetical protein